MNKYILTGLLVIAGTFAWTNLKRTTNVEPLPVLSTITNETVEPNITNDSTAAGQPAKAEGILKVSSPLAPLKRLNADPKRVVRLSGPIGGGLFGEDPNAHVIPSLLELDSRSNEPIFLFIASPGGSVFQGNMIITAMEGLKSPVYTVCVRMCASMAAVIHQYGKQRYMINRATLMFHYASGGFDGEMNKIESLYNYVKRVLQKENAYISKRIGITPEQFHNMWQSDLWIDAEDAKANNLTDEVVVTGINFQ